MALCSCRIGGLFLDHVNRHVCTLFRHISRRIESSTQVRSQASEDEATGLRDRQQRDWQDECRNISASATDEGSVTTTVRAAAAAATSTVAGRATFEAPRINKETTHFEQPTVTTSCFTDY